MRKFWLSTVALVFAFGVSAAKAAETVKEYYADGALQREVAADGAFKEYFANGRIKAEGFLKDGKYEGLVKEYDSHEATCFDEVNYAAGVRHGTLKAYCSDTLWDEWMFENGKPVAYKEYEGGQREVTFKDGLKDGVEKIYYSNGQPASEATYVQGELNGVKKTYYDSGYDYIGKLQSEVNYAQGVKTGVEKLYNKDGKLTKTIEHQAAGGFKTTCYDEAGAAVECGK